MQSDLLIEAVCAHAEGEVGNVVVAGVAPPPGDTLWEQRDWLARDGTLRALLLNEPRGGLHTHWNLLVPPKGPRADAAFLIMEPADTPPMSGSNSICVATVLLETGRVPMTEPETGLRLEVPAGLIEVRAHCEGGRVESIELENVPAFADRLGVPLEVEGLGTLTVDTAWGGDSFVLVEAAALGLSLTPEEGREIADLGARITAAANAQIGFDHPERPWRHISFCQITAPVDRTGEAPEGLSAVVIAPGKIDRSPTGTGCSARLAVMHARGEIAAGDSYVGRSIIGGRFDCRILRETTVAGRPAIVPAIRGRAWITGTMQILRDPADPWPQGYRVGDTWPMRR